jgi:hypothetical protein
MNNCENCLSQGDKAVDAKGAANIFCLVKTDWMGAAATCELFRKNADIDKETKLSIASELRQERAENRRLKKVNRATMKFVILAMIISFALFLLTAKFFDKFIF